MLVKFYMTILEVFLDGWWKVFHFTILCFPLLEGFNVLHLALKGTVTFQGVEDILEHDNLLITNIYREDINKSVICTGIKEVNFKFKISTWIKKVNFKFKICAGIQES